MINAEQVKRAFVIVSYILPTRGDYKKPMTDTGKRQTYRERPQINKQAGEERLEINLPERVMARLRILAEDSDVSTVISDAVMMFWEHRYQRALVLPKEPSEVKSIATTPEQHKCDRARELHARGIPMEDIAVELDWPLESVQAALGITELPSQPVATDRESLQQRVREMHDLGMSYTAIAKQLNAEDIPTLSGGGKWHHSSVKRLFE
jgi:hypothetical protein